MRTKELDKISVASSKRHSKRFDLSHDVNTTAMWGDCQPVCARLLVPNSDTTLKIDSLVRMAPLVRSAFARVKAKYWSVFVGMSDLMENFAPMLAQQNVKRGLNSFKPNKLPFCKANELALLCCIGAKMTIYQLEDNFSPNAPYDAYKLWRTGGNSQPNIPWTAWLNGSIKQSTYSGATQLQSKFEGYSGAWFDFGRLFDPDSPVKNTWLPIENGLFGTYFNSGHLENNVWVSDESYVSLDSADLVLERDLTFNGTTYHLAFAFRLSEFGKRLRKILIGLGYQINLNDTSEVGLLPLFAYYKAYWDVFGLTLYHKWETTSAYSFLTYCDYNDVSDCSGFIGANLTDGNVDPFVLNWFGFIWNLGSTWVTRDADYFGAHIASLSVGSAPSVAGSLIDFDTANVNLKTFADAHVNDVTNDKHAYIYTLAHGQLDCELLKSLYKVVNRNTIAGQKIADLLRSQGLGDFVDNCESRFIGYREYDCQISEVTSTTDSYNSAQSIGAVLGEQGGKSVTYQGLRNLSYSNREYGYWITIMAIVPESGMCQTVDAVNTRTLSKNDFYQPEFDGKGMEITPYNEVIGQADWSSNPDSSAPQYGTDLNRGFGFIPRYSRFKVKQNVMNGDMSIRGVRATYLPFTGDRFCEVADRKVLDVVNFSDYDDFKAYLSTPVAQLPTAGDVWRYPARYQFLGNFDRLFYNNNLAERYNSYILNQLANSNIQWGFSTWEIIRKTYDNFMVHNIMTFITHAPMLPIEDSFETKQDGNDGKGDSVIRKA